jgi:CyaY protein
MLVHRVGAADAALLAGVGWSGWGSTSGPFWPQPANKTPASSSLSPPIARNAGRMAKLEGTLMPSILSTMTSATPSSAPAASPLSDSEFHRLSQAVLAAVEATVDRWLDDDVIDIDSQRTGGLLELSLPGGSKIVLNTQPPLHEIWLAARAGGHHYRHVAGRWLDTRDGSEFFAALSQHASAQAGKALRFEPNATT